ncbi:MAG: hypothetical protein E7578_02280 [Ruminococcaceae bacterium]|nr:hypothetical protein [Oscillospiraceae bacterium]
MEKIVSLMFLSLVLVFNLFVVSGAFEIILPDDNFEEEIIYTGGDVNGDAMVNSSDLVLLRRYISGADVEIIGNADVNEDDAVNSTDVVILARRIAGANV